MKAPEKIYLQQYDEDTLICLNEWNISEEWSNKPCNEKIATNIKYIRADAFIEKACEWLRTYSEADYFELIPDANYCGAGTLNKKRMIDEFRNYMKGE